MKQKNIALSFVAVIMLASCGQSRNSDATIERKEEKPIVKLANVFTRPVEQIQEYTATVEAEVKNNIAPSVPVRIDRILVEVGDRVARGQRLVEMDANNLTQHKLQLENQEIEFKRVDELYNVGGLSKSDWERIKTNLDVSRRSYQNLQENTSLVSPINGVVTARNYDNGDMYPGGNPVLVVEQITPVKLLIHASESYFTSVKRGAPASIRFDVFGNEEFTGTISLIYPTIDPATRTFPIEVKLANQDSRVRPGMFARVTLNFGTQNHVVIPDMSIVKQAGSGDRFVYVYNNGRVTYTKIELGRRMDTEFEVLSGIENNTMVVVAGQAQLLDNMEVEVSN